MAQRKKYLISPYNFSLVCVFLALVLLGNILMFSFWISKAQGLSLLEALELGEAFGFFFTLALTLVLVIVFLRNAYEYFGTIQIYHDKVVFRTVFRKARTFLYSELKDVGIDYGTASGAKQFWIYFGKEKIGAQYTHIFSGFRIPVEQCVFSTEKKYMKCCSTAFPMWILRKDYAGVIPQSDYFVWMASN